MHTVADVAAKAATMELDAVNFKDAEGRLCRDSGNPNLIAEFIFIDGEVMKLPRSEMMTDDFGKLEFKLRPTRAHA